jgi:MBG domain (YGX type)/BspA type Leucine rich repeat region (6 copies)
MKCLFLLLISIAIATAVEPFTIVVKTDNPGVSAGNQFQLPLASTAVYNFTVNWGDGQSDVITTSTSPTHTYATVGTKTIQISENVVGGFPQIYFYNGVDGLKLMQISKWGGGKWTSMQNAFYGCSNLTITATDAATALTGTVTNFRGAWTFCSSITNFPLLNTSAGTDFIATWAGCTKLTSISALNLGNMISGGECFADVPLSVESYSALLINLAATNTNFGVTFSGSSGNYNAGAVAARNTLLGRGWQIYDGGLQLTNPFTIVVKTDNPGTSNPNQFSLPLFDGENYNFTVDWGDGTREIITHSWILTHTYSTDGTKTIQIHENVVGGFPGVFFNNSGDCKKLLQISQWGGGRWDIMFGAFAGCSNLTITATDSATALTGTVTNFDQAWAECRSLTSFPLLNTTAGISFVNSWANCLGLTSFPLLNTSAGTDFSGAWSGCSGLTSIPLLNTAAGTNFGWAWSGCSGLTSFPLLNTAAGTNFNGAWSGCSGLTGFPLLNTVAATSFSDSWSACAGLTTFPLLNSATVYDFSRAWYGCRGLTSFPVLNTGRGAYFIGTWGSCTGLLDFPLVDTGQGYSFTWAWDGCAALKNFPNLNVSAGVDFGATWRSCTGLTSFPLLNTSAGTNFSSAWSNCTGLNSFPLLNVTAGVNFGASWNECISLKSFPPLNTNAGTNFYGAWKNCINLTNFPLVNTAMGTNFSYAWSGCASLTSFSLLNTAAGTNFSNAWSGCAGLLSFPLLNTAAGIDFSVAWSGCTGLISFPLLNTLSGSNFSLAWYGCTSLASFPLLNTAGGKNFAAAWYGCTGLTSFPPLDTTAGTNFLRSWYGCTGLTSFPLLDTAAGTDFSYAWFGCSGLTNFPLLNLNNLSAGYGCFDGVTLSVDSYNALLINMASLSAKTFVVFSGGNSKYGASAVSPRSTLTTGRNWTITDGGPAAATPLTWETPTAITYGTELTSTQLNAAAGMAGTYTYVPPAGTILGAGNQTLTVTFTPTDVKNYASVTGSVTLTVNKAVLNVRAQNQSRAYGAANPALTSTITGFLNGDTASVISGSAVLATTATATSPVTTYPITVNVSGLSATNYSFTDVAGTLTVGKVVLTVTANNVSRAFGAANPVLTSTITGFQNGDTASVISGSPVLATTATASSPATTYPITVDVLGMSAANYSFTGVSGILSITQATPTVTWATPAAITYGVRLSATQLNATASIAGSFVYTPPLGTLLHVGDGQTLSVAFTPTDTLNYTTANATTLLTVNKAPLILTAANKSMVSGQAVPTLTAVGSGFVSPDSLASLDTAPVLTTTATNSSAVGTYPIVVSAAADVDYEISYVDGIMTVTAGGRHDDSSSGNGKKCGMGSGFGAAALAFMLVFRLALTRRRARFLD